MLEIFQLEFMQKAFIVGILISIITPCIGLTIVLKRFSMIGDSLSHASLSGVATGLIAGFNPILGAIFFSVMASLFIDKIRKSFKNYSELSIAIITSIGIGLAGILSGFVKNSATFNSFLFGSIVAISDFELWMVVGLSIAAIVVSLFLYKELLAITFDEQAAKLCGIPVKQINFIFTLLTAITISISARTVGTLVISSLLVLPVASAMQLAKSYKQTMLYSIIVAVASTIIGLFVSFYANFKPGGTIVLINAVFLILILIYKSIHGKYLVKYNS